ncbi:MAG: tRNA (adenosine(37)-N6)-threonylcarbamoyltransferase complex transferase subunit TsaD [Saccharofermentanales bacterium]
MKPFLCLGIESSCDETAASVVEQGRLIRSNIIASQIDLHKQYGGVVPEIASRMHVEAVLPVIDDALQEAGCTLEDIDLIAVTYGPGLVGALLVGLCAAKGLAAVSGIPLIGVNHIEGHIAANLIANPELEPPFLCLVVSGGHSHIVMVNDYNNYEVIARTRDDAAGEAFDKIARACGLGYPGGPLIDKVSQGGDPYGSRVGDPYAIHFPKTNFPDGSLDFSFSGVKTAALNYLNKIEMQSRLTGQLFKEIIDYPDFTASFQQAIVDVLADHTFKAAEKYKITKICIAGGVSANRALRKTMNEKADMLGFTLFVPPPVLCTDNAAMIACAGYYSYINRKTSTGGMDLNACPSLGFE